MMISSCSTMPGKFSHDREPAAEPTTCNELAQSLFLKDNYQQDLEKALADKKLITFTNKFVTVEHPSMNWLNRARISLNKSIKNWNSNKYPAFYIFSDEDVVPAAQKYFKVVTDKIPADSVPEEGVVKNYELVQSWIKSYENYQTEVDQLLEERISLQYNLTLLKKLKLKEDSRDIKLSVKRGGHFVDEVVTLRRSDKDLNFQIKKLKTELKEFDGTLLKNGKIKDRIIRQAALNDMMTIVQREFEYALKNNQSPTEDMTKELEKLNTLIKQPELQPTTYGVYRITNKVFIREIAALSKIDVAYKKFVQNPVLKFKEVVNAFIQNRPLNNANEPEKIGIFKRIYAKISSITVKQASIGAGVTVAAGIGFERYFSIVGNPVVTEDRDSHAVQVERTEEEAVKASEEHSSVVEVEINELTK
ncbi:MAG: hypothetical protein H7336_15640 [Bacteriovorax sp.]|nr:hypothetical protein [Bacteriovorax sp.]